MSGYGETERLLLQQHVTSLDRDVYAVFNLPPEVVAVVFAYVSRSPASFRQNLLKLVLSGDLDLHEVIRTHDASGVDLSAAREKARDFHQRVTVGYGHSSVAELSNLAFGCERISRLASAELELSNRWLSFIEFSQRYQRPRRGSYATPPELEQAGRENLVDLYHRTQSLTFDVYERLLQGLVDYLEETTARREGESPRRFRRRVERVAFEDARYALTLAVHTNLGVTGNARAFRDAIVRLLSDPYEETTALAQALREEGQAICPTLIRYAEARPYQQRVWRHFGAGGPQRPPRRTDPDGAGAGSGEPPRAVRLVDWTGRAESDDPVYLALSDDTGVYLRSYAPRGTTRAEQQALCEVLAAAASAHGAFLSEQDLLAASGDERLRAYGALLDALGPHDHPDEALKHADYRFHLTVSEANWHQLLRHSRQVDFVPARPTVEAGFTVPPNVRRAGLAGELERAVRAAEEAYRRIARASPRAAHYLVTNAHHRRVHARVTLWEMFHLVNLRGKPDAQWDIRQTVLAMRDAVRAVHPHLLEVERREARRHLKRAE